MAHCGLFRCRYRRPSGPLELSGAEARNVRVRVRRLRIVCAPTCPKSGLRDFPTLLPAVITDAEKTIGQEPVKRTSTGAPTDEGDQFAVAARNKDLRWRKRLWMTRPPHHLCRGLPRGHPPRSRYPSRGRRQDPDRQARTSTRSTRRSFSTCSSRAGIASKWRTPARGSCWRRTGSRYDGRKPNGGRGQAWGLRTIESFHTHGAPPLPAQDPFADEAAGQDV